jgi:hypothetical protein
MDPWILEEALPIVESFEGPEDMDVLWIDPPPHFNGTPTLYPGASSGRVASPDPDLPAIAHMHSCEYSATGYFGNEGSDIDLYVYAALHVTIPPQGHEARAGTTAERPEDANP